MYDKQNRQLIVYERNNGRLLRYDIKGNFVSSVSGLNKEVIARDIVNLDDGTFLCYEYLHGPVPEREYDGVWRMDAEGKMLDWVWTSSLIHPSIGSLAYLSELKGGKVGFYAIEDDCYYIIDKDGINCAVQYDIKGPSAKSYAGENSEFIVNLVTTQNKSMNSNNCTHDKDNYIFGVWSSEVMNKNYYTVYSKKDKKIVTGRNFDTSMPDGSQVLMTYMRPDGFYFCPVYSNTDNTLIVPAYATSLISDRNSEETKRFIGKLFDGMSEDELADANPVLQVMHLKK